MNTFWEDISLFVKQTSQKDSSLFRFAYKLETVDLETLFESLRDTGISLFYYSKPNEDKNFLGIGKIKSQYTEQTISSAAKNNLSSDNSIVSVNFNSGLLDSIPLVLGSEKFPLEKNESLWNDFEGSNWFIPQMLIFVNKKQPYFIFQFFVDNPELSLLESVIEICSKTEKSQNNCSIKKTVSATDLNDWTTAINKALLEISSQCIQKVVLARRIMIALNDSLNFSKALSRLSEKYPECITFAYKENNSIFFGTTPEKLFSIKENKIETEALAGSIARGINPEDDLQKQTLLLENQKEINEHNNVLSFILSNLKDHCEVINYATPPQIKKLSNIQHLQTKISSTLKDGIDVLELLKRLHPTPAVCGLPKKQALELIKELEYFDRGLYSGVIGWYNEKGESEFSVGIRSALLKDNTLTAYAGCGIVEGSNPVLEFQETELKFKPILSLLENEITN